MRKLFLAIGAAAISLASCQSSTAVLDVGNTGSTSTSSLAAAATTTSDPDLAQTTVQTAPVVAEKAERLAALDPGQVSSDPAATTSAAPELSDPKPARPRTRKTYLINGLASAVPFIGFGLTNLQKKMPQSKLYSYLSPVEGSAAIAPAVTKDIIATHKKDPDVEVNLIGISYGANLITQIASKLNKRGIKVHYLGIIEGTTLKNIPSNVRTADNFTCTNIDCTRAKARLASSNSVTNLESFKFNTSHIPMGNNKKMHDRIIRQING